MKTIPETWGDMREVFNRPIPSSLLTLPLTTPPFDLATILDQAGQRDEWYAAGGIDLWASPQTVHFDDPTARAVAQRIRVKLVGSPMRALLNQVDAARRDKVRVSMASVGNTDHDMHPLLGRFTNRKALHYQPFGGHTNTRQAIALLHRSMGWAPSTLGEEHVFVTNGTSFALLMLFNILTLRAPGERPARVGIVNKKGIWPNALDMVTQSRSEYVGIDPDHPNLDDRIKDVDLVYIIQPAIFETRWEKASLRRLIDACRKYGVIVVCDGVYNAFERPEHFVSLLAMYPEGVVEAGSMSKEFAFGGAHLGSIKVHNPHLIQYLVPALQSVLCVTDFGGLQSWVAPTTLLTSREYLAAIPDTYDANVAEVMKFADELAQYGVKILQRDVGPYVVLEFPFDSTKFSGWMTGEFRTEIDGEQWTAVGTAMPYFYPKMGVGYKRYRISAVQGNGGERRFMQILSRAVPVFMETHRDEVDWEQVPGPTRTKLAIVRAG